VRTRLQREVDVAAPAEAVWDFVTDWPRQGDWIPKTRVERVDAADGLGGRFRAWSGLGRVGFWDPMTITAWERTQDGGGWLLTSRWKKLSPSSCRQNSRKLRFQSSAKSIFSSKKDFGGEVTNNSPRSARSRISKAFLTFGISNSSKKR